MALQTCVCLWLAANSPIGYGQERGLPVLPFQAMTVSLGEHAWFRAGGEVAVKNGVAQVTLPCPVLVETVQVEAMEGSPKPTSVSISTAFDKMPPALAIKYPESTTKATVRVTGFLRQLRWTPRYQLTRGANNGSRLQFEALLRNDGGDLDLPAVELAAAHLSAQGATGNAGSNDATAYELPGKWALPAMSIVPTGILDEPAASEGLIEWLVGGVGNEPPGISTKDVVRELIRIPNRTAKTLPEGRLTLIENQRPRAVVTFPATEAGQTAEVSLGPAVGVSVAREEVEIERKVATARRENDPPDRVQMAGSLTVTNRRTAAVRMRIVKTFIGVGLAASDDGRIVRKPNQLGREQPVGEIRWDLLIPAGQTKRLTYGTMLHVITNEPRESRSHDR